MPDAVAIQGEAGSFSHAAALETHGDVIRLVPCATFVELFRAVEGGEAASGVVPIENTLAGSVHENYNLLSAHPLALAQCRQFFLTHPDVVAVPAYDTAGSVRDLMSGKVDADAAIASKLAAELYGADVIAEGLEDHAENYTRFLVVAREPAARAPAESNKTSVMVSLGNTPGSLYRALGVFAAHGLNLTKIESRPLPGRPWERARLDLRQIQ